MTTADFQKISDTVPKSPGVYRFIDADGTIIYVGKAKSLRSRLGSYFGSKKHQAAKTRTMVHNAHHFEFTIVSSETDALLLENSLIKRLQPRYNVALKDGKSYSYICIKKEAFPRVFLTRRVIRDGSTYFGPYTSKGRIKIILELIKTLFPLRTCPLNLAKAQVDKGKYKVCLEYHIKNCHGPCEGYENEVDYLEKIDQVKNILKGNFQHVKQHFQKKMEDLALNLDFEAAQLIKVRLEAFEDYQYKSTVVNPSIQDADVFAIASEEKIALVTYLKVVNGAIINTYSQELIKNLDEDEKEILEFVVPELRERFNSIATEIYVPFEIELTDPNLRAIVPKIGDKRKLVELAENNVKYDLLQRRKEAANRTNKLPPAERILKTLQSDLNMDKVPLHIECFDNSNIQGTNPVSSCVVFKNARPAKGDYRHYHVKTVIGPNDFASMEEVVYRRYRRLKEEAQPLPDLVIIDGGKGQLSSAMASIKKLGLEGQMVVIGIAKRLEEIFFPGDTVPLYINKKSESLKLIQQARNEAHRFAITFHRQIRSKNALGTELTEIPGVGEKTAEKLLATFGSVKQLKSIPKEQLIDAVGKGVANKVFNYLHAQSGDTSEEE